MSLKKPPLDSLYMFITACRKNPEMALGAQPADYIDQVVDLEAVGRAGHTPLGSASFHACDWPEARPSLYVLAQTLLERGADPNGLYADAGRSPLFGAVLRRDLKMAKILVERGADVECGIPSCGHTPLQRSTRETLELVKFLIASGANVNKPTISTNKNMHIEGEVGGEVPLHYAAMFGLQEIAECLVESGADLNRKNKENETPLDWARRADRPAGYLHWLVGIGAQ